MMQTRLRSGAKRRLESATTVPAKRKTTQTSLQSSSQLPPRSDEFPGTHKSKKDAELSTDEKATRSASVSKFLKNYRGLDDMHIPLFERVLDFTQAKDVLYPGCHRHFQASLVFASVTYIDNYKALIPDFSDTAIHQWIDDRKRYEADTSIKFFCKDFNDSASLELADESFDLLISMSAGIVSKGCARYLRFEGYFLVSDRHMDARMTFLNPEFQMRAVYDLETKSLLTDPEDLKGHFQTTKGDMITMEQVQESIEKPKARRKFKLVKEDVYYLFQRVNPEAR